MQKRTAAGRQRVLEAEQRRRMQVRAEVDFSLSPAAILREGGDGQPRAQEASTPSRDPKRLVRATATNASPGRGSDAVLIPKFPRSDQRCSGSGSAHATPATASADATHVNHRENIRLHYPLRSAERSAP